ncbi:MAG TPA: 1,4-alpha-glucan branching protein GlgB [Gaiellaceae bacterium]|nr:1,4-alpha-glucan branching protein GlgB [Gaiellaceae bacterium]
MGADPGRRDRSNAPGRGAGLTQAQASAFGELDIWLARAGRHEELWAKLGAHPVENGVRFAVWAPNARYVSVVGDFNGWDPAASVLSPVDGTGIWEGVVEGAKAGERYKFHLDGKERADPLAFEAEVPPKTASVIFESHYVWGDEAWVEARRAQVPLDRPLAIYEVHAPSWRKGLGWRQLAEQLATYVNDLGFTHVELLPVMQHPFSGSWGYQVTGYYAPLSTMGSPDDFRYFVDHLHQNGIGVILDWVPAHFPRDEWGLARFDGTALYEHADARRGAHPDWGTLVFNLGRSEVQNFLLANALFWLREYHADGLRVDAVASMLYLDYSRKAGEWVPNRFGGREDLEAVEFLKEFNELVHAREPGVISAAEESTAWPAVSRPTYVGGLGFGFKWNMGWMHDTLGYFEHDPVHRRYHHHELTFSLVYAWNENFILPLSHDEVVHGKRSLLGKMPGDRWQQLANLRALFAYMWAHPGKKLLFMGGELATPWEWTEADELPWWLLEHPEHAGMRDLVRDLNRLYAEEPALWEVDFSPAGFRWLEPNDAQNNVFAFMRLSADGERHVVCVANLSPVPREGYRVGLPLAGEWEELLNSDSAYYGGGGVGNLGTVTAQERGWHDQPFSAELTVPPLGVLWLRRSS